MKTCIFNVRLAALPLALAAAFPVLAQTSQTGTTPQLKETIVTATRSESRAGAVLADVTVIGRDDIERNSGRTLAELVARVAGVQMSGNGGLGKNSSIFIRGTESRHVLLLIDGVRVGSATAGQANFDNIPLESIERIEVLKGPASALYGSDAVGGVIQIFTRKGQPGFAPYGSVTLGSAGRREVSAGLSGGSGDVTYSLGAQTLRETGFSATNPKVGTGYNSDRDGFSQDSLNASVDWKFAPGWKLDARALYADGENNYDSGSVSSFDTRADLQTKVYGMGVEGQLTGNWKSRLAYGKSEDNSTNRTSAIPSSFNTHQNQMSWLNEVATPLGKVLAGLERVEQRVSGTTTYTVDKRTTDSVFVGLNGETRDHSWQLNLRNDDDSQFGGATTGFVAYGYKFTQNLRSHVSYGTSFKAPSFNTLYFPGFGNPSTQPEKGRNSEIGLAYALGEQEFKAVYFDNKIQGFITSLPVVTNIPRARIQGWTLSYEGQLGNFAVRTALDLLDARNTVTGQKLPRRADQQLTAGIDYTTGAWKLGATALAASERFDTIANTTRLAGFTTVDLHADYAFSKNWSLQARVNNLNDKVYQTAQGYNQQGRAAYLTLRYQPK